MPWANGVVSILATLLGDAVNWQAFPTENVLYRQIGVTLSPGKLIGLSFKLFFHMETVDGVSGLHANFWRQLHHPLP